MTRQVLIVIGAALLSFGSIGLIVGLTWLTVAKTLGTLPYILEARFETLLYMLPALLPVSLYKGAIGLLDAYRRRDQAAC